MSYVKHTFKSLLNASSDNLFDKRTIDHVLRAILEALIEENTESVVFLKIANTSELEGVIKRAKYNNNINIQTLTITSKGMEDFDFLFSSSSRFSAVLIWNKTTTKSFVSMNSDTVSDAFKVLKDHIDKSDFEKFNSYKPERRSNKELNNTILKIIKNLNENILENNFNQNEQTKESNNQISNTLYKEINEQKIRKTVHEIRNQLSIVDIYANILQKKGADEKALNIIRKSLDIIKNEISELRSFEEYNLKNVDVKNIIECAIQMEEEILKANHNKIFFKFDKNNYHSLLDENKFLGVLINLIKNANEITKNDEIKITLMRDDNFGKIQIENHGAEIPNEIKDKIFNEGYTTKKEGNGVGLFLCKKYLKNMSCAISLLGSNSEKTVFEIIFPLI